MFVESMSYEEIVREVKSDFTAVDNKCRAQVKAIAKVMRKTNMSSFKKFYDYRSPVNKNQWLYQIAIKDRRSCRAELALLSQFTTHKGYCAVKYFPDSDSTYIIRSHFFTRYNERNEIGLVMPREIMVTFVDENEYFIDQKLEKTGENQHEVFVQMAKGVGLGIWRSDIKLYDIRTFITNSMLKGNQIEISKQIEAQYGLELQR